MSFPTIKIPVQIQRKQLLSPTHLWRVTQPPLRRSDMETMSGDSLQLPSEIFGSPNSCEPNVMIKPEEQPDVVVVSENLNDGMNKCPSSYKSTSKSEDDLDQALKDMHRALTHSQNVEKRKFFAQTIAGELS